MISSISVQTIPHDEQRYETVGDWRIVEDGNARVLYVTVSNLGDWRMNAAIALHEIVEGLLCVHHGVQETHVTEFDELYEDRRLGKAADDLASVYGCTCIPSETSEPGEDIHAPYRNEHAVADIIERIFAFAIGLRWADYNARVEAL